jgi:hypothetical protein
VNTVKPKNTKIDVKMLKEKCPLPDLLRRIGLGKHAKSSCPSPFRSDSKPSWGIFQRDGHWYFKDFATDETGDEISVLGQYLKLDEKKDFKAIVERYQEIANQEHTPETELANDLIPSQAAEVEAEKPNSSLFSTGTTDQLARLSASRGIAMEGLQWAQDRGVLVFGRWYGGEVYGVRDGSGWVMEIRKLDGSLFDAIGGLTERKSHAIKGSQKKWPVGIQEAAGCPMIVLVEGIPDFLGAHQIVIEEGRQGNVAPVSMLCASVSIAEPALPYFKGKHVRLFPHADEAGVKAARKWSQQLKAVGVAKVDSYDFARVKVAPNEHVKDLCDLIGWRKSHPEYESKLLA